MSEIVIAICKLSCRIISKIANYLKYNYFWDGDGIENVTSRLWKVSYFCSRHTVGIAGDDIMFHILVVQAFDPYTGSAVVLISLISWWQHNRRSVGDNYTMKQIKSVPLTKSFVNKLLLQVAILHFKSSFICIQHATYILYIRIFCFILILNVLIPDFISIIIFSGTKYII